MAAHSRGFILLFAVIYLLTSYCGYGKAYSRNSSKISIENDDLWSPPDTLHRAPSSEENPSELPFQKNHKASPPQHSHLSLSLLRQPSTMSHTDFNRIADSLLTQVPKSRYESILSGVYLQNDARKIGSHLREISNEELGVTAMQAAFDSSHFSVSTVNPAEDVKEISKRLQLKAEKYLDLLDKNMQAVKTLYQYHLLIPLNSVNCCCKMDSSLFYYDEAFGGRISKDLGCDSIPPVLPKDAFLPGVNLTTVFKQNLEENPSIRWQYFISTIGAQIEYPAYNLGSEPVCKQEMETRHKSVYLRTVQPFTKHVVIVIDHGNSMSPYQLLTAKTIGKYIISTLSHRDKVGLIGLAGDVQFSPSGGCLPHQMVQCTYETKSQFTRFIDGLQKAQDPTSHMMGFLKAFEMIQNTLDLGPNSTDPNSEALIIYISRGLLSSIADAKDILETIARENLRNGNRVLINTYTVLEEGKPVMYEKAFLKDVAEQNFKKYHVDLPNSENVKRGVMITVNSTENLSFIMGNFLSILSHEVNPNVHYSLPYWDSVGKGLVISITKAVHYFDKLLGVVGIDIPVGNVAEEVTYYGQLPHSYAFLMEETGVAVMHPSFSRPAFASGQPMHTDVWHLEQRGDTRRIKRDIIKENFGEEQVHITNSSTTPFWRSAFDRDSNTVLSLQYNWHKVEGTPYTVCIVTSIRKEEYKGIKGKATREKSIFAYHRLNFDLKTYKLCRHLKVLSTNDISTIFLSASSFQSPFEFLSQDETQEQVQKYMDYLNDQNNDVINPGLKITVKSDAQTISVITSDWKNKLDSEFSKYVVRRYSATQGGVFLTFPGTVMDKMYDPTKREWYTRALEYPGKIIVSAPYLDVGGAGYIVTLSSVIFEGKYASMHSLSDRVVAVMGMDLTLGYFYKLISEVVSVCEQDRIACFLMDDRGYLISHPSLIEPNSRSIAEQQHITHKEPLVAGDILNHKDFAKKKLCNSFSDRTIQRFYLFNTSLEGVLTNLVHGESCAKYMLTAVPGTNVFLGIVNQTCDVVTTFCPCSMTDRLCLNCYRMEQTECECPCECPLEMNLCSGQLMDNNDNNPSCPRFPEELNTPLDSFQPAATISQCFKSKCNSRLTKNDCFGVLGCEWCQLDAGGTQLKKEFCTEQRNCFGGIIGGRSPYADEIVDSSGLQVENYFTAKNTPVGPVAGGIMGCFLVLALGVYCYRYHVHCGIGSDYQTSQEGEIHMSHVEEQGGEEQDLNDDGNCRASHSNAVLASFENAAVASPYRFATGYRRRPGGDSDPGYSTMTPHDDSEHVPYIEPLLLGKDRHRVPASSQLSSSSRSSSPLTYNPNATTPPNATPLSLAPPPPTTRTNQTFGATHIPHYWGQMFANSRDVCQTVILEIPPSHNILAQVQVHVADTC